MKKTIFLFLVSMTIVYGKSIAVCEGALLGENLTCKVDGNEVIYKTSLAKMYKEGWRLITVEKGRNYIEYFYLEK